MLAGSLQEFSVEDIFALLAATGKTGILDLNEKGSGRAEARVWTIEGHIIMAIADLSQSPLAARLMHSGDFNTDQIDKLVAAQGKGEIPRLISVLSNGVGDEARVGDIIADQIRDALFDITLWQGGEFSFKADKKLVMHGHAMPIEEAVDAVQARSDDWETLSRDLPDSSKVLIFESRLDSTPMVSLTPEQWEVLTLVDGRRSMVDLVRLTGQGRFTVGQHVVALLEQGLINKVEGRVEQPAARIARELARIERRHLRGNKDSLSETVEPDEPSSDQDSGGVSEPGEKTAESTVDANEGETTSPDSGKPTPSAGDDQSASDGDRAVVQGNNEAGGTSAQTESGDVSGPGTPSVQRPAASAQPQGAQRPNASQPQPGVQRPNAPQPQPGVQRPVVGTQQGAPQPTQPQVARPQVARPQAVQPQSAPSAVSQPGQLRGAQPPVAPRPVAPQPGAPHAAAPQPSPRQVAAPQQQAAAQGQADNDLDLHSLLSEDKPSAPNRGTSQAPPRPSPGGQPQPAVATPQSGGNETQRKDPPAASAVDDDLLNRLINGVSGG